MGNQCLHWNWCLALQEILNLFIKLYKVKPFSQSSCSPPGWFWTSFNFRYASESNIQFQSSKQSYVRLGFLLRLAKTVLWWSFQPWNIPIQMIGSFSLRRCCLIRLGNPIVDIRQSYDHLIYTLGIFTLVRQHHFINGLVWDCSNSIASALVSTQSRTEPLLKTALTPLLMHHS